MVVTFLPATIATGVWQERTALPSRCTVQAPHMPAPQPYFVPVSLRCSRTAQSSGVSGAASTLADLPLTVKVKVMMTSRRRAGKRSNDGRRTRCEVLRLSQVTQCLYLARQLLVYCISRT